MLFVAEIYRYAVIGELTEVFYRAILVVLYYCG